MAATDEPAFRRLYAQVRMRELAGTGWADADKQAFCDSQYTMQDQHYRQQYANFDPWAVCRDADVIGRMYLATYDDKLILMDITITASDRTKGIGTALLQDVTRHADAFSMETRLHVEPDNPARRLYRRLGFIETGDAGVYQEMRRAPVATGDSAL
jgi:ribosomal protein S18 acetylase RimI-like enzyme